MAVKKKNRAFTLVELLVVISIIAMLLAVLMPALSKAREQAKVMTCAANAKQIGISIETCRAANDGAVPVMLNRFTPKDDPAGPYPARSRLLSVAMASVFAKERANLTSKETGQFDPDKNWGDSQDNRTKPNYFKKYLPKFYVCPFVRDRAVDVSSDGTSIDFKNGPVISLKTKTGVKEPIQTKIRTGSGESYAVWRYERKRDVRPNTYAKDLYNLLGEPYGTPKYGVLVWNNYAELSNTSNWTKLDNSPVKWSSKQLKRVGAGGMGDATIAYCEQGQTDSHQGGTNIDNGIYNYGSHKKSNSGGTNAIFADTHVEWVEGVRIGWP